MILISLSFATFDKTGCC